MSQLESLTIGDHVFAVYADNKSELDDCFAFLKEGFENGEAIWIGEEDLTKDEIRQRIREEWKITNLEELEAKGDIIITTSKEWYYPDGQFDLEKVIAKWHSAVQDAVSRGKKGLRAFDAVDGLIKDGFADDLVNFEAALGSAFKIPFTAICAYKVADVTNKITAEQLSKLHTSHGLHRELGYNVLENPLLNQHIALMYDTDEARDLATARFINEGLKRNQLCVYASVHTREKIHQERMKSLIDNYDVNVTAGNLLVIDLASFYVSALSDNLQPFKELKNELMQKVTSRSDKHVRLVGDCVTFLFQNRHFDEFMRLEEWWHTKPFKGSYLCPFPKKILADYPYDLHRYRIHISHDVVANEKGDIIMAYFPDKEHKRRTE